MQKLKAKIEWNGKKAEFEGEPNEVWKSINKFLMDVGPTVISLSEFMIKTDLNRLFQNFRGIIKLDKDVGPIVSRRIKFDKLDNKEKVLFCLMVRKLAFLTGHSEVDIMEVEDVRGKTGIKKPGVELSKLASKKLVLNVGSPQKGKYRITDYGIEIFCEDVVPKLYLKGEIKRDRTKT